MFRTECQDRHFWLAVKSSLLGHKFRFDVEGLSRIHTLQGQQAAECGYTIVLDSKGDLVLRASFLACNVVNEKDSDLRLLVWFVNQDVHGEETSYPLQLTCPLDHPWRTREIVCEENYMEVSVSKRVPPATHQGGEWMTPSSGWLGEGLQEWRVVFRVPGLSQGMESPPMKEETLPVEMAQLLGYHITASETRIILRCAYGSRLSYKLQENGTEVEVVSATVIYKHQWTLLKVDTSVACTTSKAIIDGANILWTFPKIPFPLVHPPFLYRGLRVGVEGDLLSNCTTQHRGYQIKQQGRNLEIRIPFGAEGGYIKSHVVDGRYYQSYFLDLFYVQQWEDAQWPATVYRSHRPLSISQLPQTLRLTNETVTSEGVFSVSLGSFPSDVSLYYISVGEESMSWAEAQQLGFKLSQVSFQNSTHAYVLQTPFTNPLISQKYIGHGYRRYTLKVIFTLSISPHAEIYHHPATVESDLQDVVLPRVDGVCTSRGVQLLLHHGNLFSQFEVYIGGRRLDWELVELAGYELVTREEHSSIEVPLYGLGMAYEGLSMDGLEVTVGVSVEDRETDKMEHTFKQQCVFPVRELLVCLPDSKVLVMVDTSSVYPPINPSHTSLLDPSCGPAVVEGSRAIYSFSLESCGTIRTFEEDEVVYTNEVRYTPPNLDDTYPNFKIPIGCVHPVEGSPALVLYHPRPLLPWAPRRVPRSQLSGARQLPFIRGRTKHRFSTNR